MEVLHAKFVAMFLSMFALIHRINRMVPKIDPCGTSIDT